MVYGYNRIPIVSWLKSNAQEGLEHAHKAGELATLLGGHPSLRLAIANKHARMIWAILAKGEDYDPEAWRCWSRSAPATSSVTP